MEGRREVEKAMRELYGRERMTEEEGEKMKKSQFI